MSSSACTTTTTNILQNIRYTRTIFWRTILFLFVSSAIIQFIVLKQPLPSIAQSSSSIRKGRVNRQNERQVQQQEVDVPIEDQQQQELPLCTSEQLDHGEWVAVRYKKPPYMPASPKMRCLPNIDYNKPWDTYEWQPKQSNNCQYTSQYVDKKRNSFKNTFCNNMNRNDKIAIVGDSVSFEHYSSLIHLLGQRIKIPKPNKYFQPIQRSIHCPSSNNGNTTTSEKTIHLIYQRDDYLKEHLSDTINNFDNNPPRILVINRGAHYVPDDRLIDDIYNKIGPTIKSWYNMCKQNSMDCQLYFRTTLPGHPQCEKQPKYEPSSNNNNASFFKQEEMEQLLLQNVTNSENIINYHWNEFKHQNELFIHEIQNYLDNNILPSSFYVMNTYNMYLLRPDIHRVHDHDCLHTCAPDHDDLNSKMLLHYIKMHKQKNQNQQNNINLSLSSLSILNSESEQEQ